MYLTDKDYGDNDFYTNVITNYSEDPKFDKGQIQPASIDLRLSSTVWFQKWRPFGKIDVSKHGAIDFAASKYWKERQISNKKPLKIRPNETVFARTHEEINVPGDCCAKIEAKSSTARLSLSVTYSDYCNPKYKGHYPLQIHNSGKNTIVLYPYMEICQLILVKLDNNVKVSYDDDSRGSNYAKYDDGSPSKWWETKTNKEIRKRFFEEYGSAPIDLLIDKIDNAISASFAGSSFIERNKKQVYKRLDKFLGKNPKIDKDKTFEEFFRKEGQKRRFLKYTLSQIVISAIPVISPIGAIAAIVTNPGIMEIIKGLSVFYIICLLLLTILIIGALCMCGFKIYFKLSDYVESYLTKDKQEHGVRCTV